jgi:lipopolysaccharide biosynthesis glycosyltransferase
MRKAIYTLNIPNRKNEIFDVCVNSVREYAKRIGVDFIERNSIQDHRMSNKNDYENIIMEKFYIYTLLRYYDRILYLDADILIKKDAPDIFKDYSDENYAYLYNEVKFNDVQYDKQIEVVKNLYDIKWPKKEHYDFYNAGVMLVSKNQRKLFEYLKDDYFKFNDLPMIVDEPYLHYNIYKYNIPIKELDKRYNTMIYFEDDGWFLHFANVLDRKERIKKYL